MVTQEQASLLAAAENEVKKARERASRRRALAESTFQKESMLALADIDDASAQLYETFVQKMKSEWGL
jgi:hypothetical protein